MILNRRLSLLRGALSGAGTELTILGTVTAVLVLTAAITLFLAERHLGGGLTTLPEAQVLLLDTPGFHGSEKALNRALNEIVDQVVRECDAALLLVDPADGWDAAHEALRSRLREGGAQVLVVANKSDRGI